MEVIRKDVVVIGLGAFGSAALWRLAQRGADVAGIERHGIGHHLGSSHGATRLFRIACQEHPGLPPIALKSLELWTELGDQTGEPLVRQSGCLSAGSPQGHAVSGVIAAAAAAGLPVRQLSHAELVARQPQYAGLAPGDVAVWDPGAGICYPERNVRAHTAAARGWAPASTRTRWSPASRPAGTASRYAPRRSSSGPRRWWSRPARGSARWCPACPWCRAGRRSTGSGPPTRGRRSSPWTGFPAFIWERHDGGGLWGHGSAEDFGVKIGPENAATAASAGFDPEEMDRYIHLDTDVDS